MVFAVARRTGTANFRLRGSGEPFPTPALKFTPALQGRTASRSTGPPEKDAPAAGGDWGISLGGTRAISTWEQKAGVEWRSASCSQAYFRLIL